MGAHLGQHFLHDPRVLEDILAAAAVQPGERVLEVGPGRGVLTRPLVEAVKSPTGGGEVVAIEADPRLAAALATEALPGLTVVTGDAVRTDLARLSAPRPFDALVANLPYQISGPITVAFLALLGDPATRWRRAVLMYQREFADRLLAGARSPNYGRLSVHAARWVRTELVRHVPPGAFTPAPAVHSVVVRLVPHAAPPFAVADDALWTAAVDGTFAQRRKQLRNTLPPAVAALGVPRDATLAGLEALGVATKRPEDLAPATFAALVERLARAGGGGGAASDRDGRTTPDAGRPGGRTREG